MTNSSLKLQVIGLGYVGLPTYLILKESGFNVSGVDIDTLRIQNLLEGKISLDDAYLDELISGIEEKDLSVNVSKADVYFIAVPTPFINSSKLVDKKYIESVLTNLSNFVDSNSIIVIESTIPPGTTKELSTLINVLEERNFVHCPERILPGNLYQEIINNNRVIGCEDLKIGELIKSIYATFSRGTIVITDLVTAELSKVIENSYRDVNIAFANEVLKISRYFKVDPYELIRISNMHERVNILNPGPGVGGHCIPVDPWFLVSTAPEESTLLYTARTINDGMPRYLFDFMKRVLDEFPIQFNRIGVYGLTYKANVNDFRESPSYRFMEIFKNYFGFNPIVYDPYLNDSKTIPSIFLDFCDKSDLIIIMVNHQHIIDNSEKLSGKIVIDTKNIEEILHSIKL